MRNILIEAGKITGRKQSQERWGDDRSSKTPGSWPTSCNSNYICQAKSNIRRCCPCCPQQIVYQSSRSWQKQTKYPDLYFLLLFTCSGILIMQNILINIVNLCREVHSLFLEHFLTTSTKEFLDLRKLLKFFLPLVIQILHTGLWYTFKGTVLWDRFRKCWRKIDLGLNKGRGWFLNFSKAPLIFGWNKTSSFR